MAAAVVLLPSLGPAAALMCEAQYLPDQFLLTACLVVVDNNHLAAIPSSMPVNTHCLAGAALAVSLPVYTQFPLERPYTRSQDLCDGFVWICSSLHAPVRVNAVWG